jgi:hypothetical protein
MSIIITVFWPGIRRTTMHRGLSDGDWNSFSKAILIFPRLPRRKGGLV